MSDEDTQQIDMRELLSDPAPASATPQLPEGTPMSFDWSWYKDTGLDMAQHAANVFIAIGGADGFNLLHLDWKASLGLCGGAAVVALARSISAYRLPTKAAKVISAAAPNPSP